MTINDYALPPEHVERSAQDKLRWLWDELITPTEHPRSGLPPLTKPFATSWRKAPLVFLLPDRLERSLTRTDDVMEAGRPKAIHAHGTVAKVELLTEPDSPFTGLLAPPPAGGAVGLIRMSLVARASKKQAITPGFGLKLLIDGAPSADLLAMNHTVGQGRDFDLFANTMTNDLTDTHRELRRPHRIMGFFFDRISHNPRRLTSTHLAGQRQDGSPVDAPVVPQRLEFAPTGAAAAIFRDRPNVDFRLVLADVPADTPLYDVVGVRDDRVDPIGTLVTRSSFVSSDGGDRLYFRHVQDPEDRKQR